jgi:hypothetical protein
LIRFFVAPGQFRRKVQLSNPLTDLLARLVHFLGGPVHRLRVAHSLDEPGRSTSAGESAAPPRKQLLKTSPVDRWLAPGSGE